MTSTDDFHSASERQLHEDTGPSELHARIAEAAYCCAEQRGFAPGHEIDDWLQAERGIERALGPRSEH